MHLQEGERYVLRRDTTYYQLAQLEYFSVGVGGTLIRDGKQFAFQLKKDNEHLKMPYNFADDDVKAFLKPLKFQEAAAKDYEYVEQGRFGKNGSYHFRAAEYLQDFAFVTALDATDKEHGEKLSTERKDRQWRKENPMQAQLVDAAKYMQDVQDKLKKEANQFLAGVAEKLRRLASAPAGEGGAELEGPALEGQSFGEVRYVKHAFEGGFVWNRPGGSVLTFDSEEGDHVGCIARKNGQLVLEMVDGREIVLAAKRPGPQTHRSDTTESIDADDLCKHDTRNVRHPEPINHGTAIKTDSTVVLAEHDSDKHWSRGALWSVGNTWYCMHRCTRSRTFTALWGVSASTCGMKLNIWRFISTSHMTWSDSVWY